ncbi:MAG: hypothetical protein Q8Q73_14305 [Stagnimonas sp.]|nr:hypothetical protein [Stagnimonas sp.]
MRIPIPEGAPSALPSARPPQRRINRVVPLLTAVLLLSSCDTYQAGKLIYLQETLRQECFGQSTNSCTNRSIKFNIAVLRANDAETWIPFNEVRTKEQMIEVFGEAGWMMFEESVNSVRDQAIEHLQSRRPGFFSRWFLGERRPLDGGVRAFVGPQDLVPIKHEIQRQFLAQLKESGWTPSPEIAARFATEGVTSPVTPSSDAAGGEPAPLEQPNGESPAATSPENTVSSTSTFPSPGWQAIQKQIVENPQSYVPDCIEHYVESAGRLGGVSREEALQQPGLEGSCQQELVDFQNCMTLDLEASERCYEALTQDWE